MSKVSRNTRNQAIMRKNRKAAKTVTPKVLELFLKKIPEYSLSLNLGLVKHIRNNKTLATVINHIDQSDLSSNITQPKVL
jgi:hypothetical protein